MSTQSSDNNKRIAKNTLLLYFRMFFIMLVTLYTSRVVLSVLGVQDFGIYNIVGGITVMFSFFNTALTSATQRFLSFELGKKNTDGFRTIINVSFIVYVILSIVIFLLGETIGMWFLTNKMEIPSDKISDAVWVLHFSLLAFIFGMIRTPYNACIIAYERMSFYAIISIIEVLLRLLIVYLLLLSTNNKLIVYSVLTAVVVGIVTFLYVIYNVIIFKEARPRKEKDFSVLRKLLGFSGWSVLGSFATVSANQGVNIVMNMFFGVSVNAAMGISHQISQAVNQFVSNFQIAFNPQITKNYASGNNQYLLSLIEHSGKLSFFLMSIISLPIVVGIDIVLDIWLTVVPEYTEMFCQLIVISYLIDTFSAPLYMTVQATGKIKAYQICVSILFLMNILLSYAIFSIGFSPQFALVVRILISILLLAYRLFFIHKSVEIPMKNYVINGILKPLCLVASIFTLSMFVYTQNEGYLYKLLVLLFIMLIAILLIYLIGLSSNERKFINEFIFKIKNKRDKL